MSARSHTGRFSDTASPWRIVSLVPRMTTQSYDSNIKSLLNTGRLLVSSSSLSLLSLWEGCEPCARSARMHARTHSAACVRLHCMSRALCRVLACAHGCIYHRWRRCCRLAAVWWGRHSWREGAPPSRSSALPNTQQQDTSQTIHPSYVVASSSYVIWFEIVI